MAMSYPPTVSQARRNIRVTIRWIGRLITALLGGVIPLGVSTLVMVELYRDVGNDLEMMTGDLLAYIYVSPEYWKFQTERLEDLLSDAGGHGVVTFYGVSDDSGKIAASAALQSAVQIKRCKPVVFAGRTEATLCGAAPADDLVSGLMMLWIVFGMIAAASYQFLYIKPVEILDATILELEQKAKEARKADRAKSEFLSIMSHEIRTPLNGILGMAELLGGTELSKEQQTYSDTVSSSGRALLSIINDILDFSKIDAQRVEVNNVAFNLRDVVDDVGKLLAFQAGQKMLDFYVRLDPSLPRWFKGDEAKIRQILLNLAGNAVKFTEAGSVSIHLTSTSSAENGTMMVRGVVSDTGAGIAEAALGSIFDKFSRVDGAYTSKQEGTGLGLAICKGLVEVMGGTIEVRSRLGHGSTFSFQVPLTAFSDSETQSELAALREKVRGKHVLLLDDHPEQQAILQELLDHWGVTVEPARDAEIAVALLEAAQTNGREFDLVLVDQRLAGVSSAEVFAALDHWPEARRPSVVVLSAIGETGAMRPLDERWPHFFVHKPVSEEALIEAVAGRIGADLSGAVATEAASVATMPSDAFAMVSPVLVVDDNATNRLVVQKFLKKLGIEPEFAVDGLDAIDMFQTVRPKVILMDVSMPVMDGLEATENIREIEARTGQPACYIIGLTANATIGFEETCLDAGMDAYLTKPMSFKRLSEKLARVALYSGSESRRIS